MLAHSGRHLREQLESARQQQRSFSEYLSPRAINWDILLRQAIPLRQVQVESLTPLSLPSQAGVPARLQAPMLEGEVRNQTSYQLPDLQFTLLDPLGESVQQLEIHCGRFTTFAQGRADRQVLEYLATLIGYELAALGFSCQRADQHLVFAAEPMLAGWNLTLSRLSFPDSPFERCSGGLVSGISSRSQQAGRLAFVHWGPYRLNGQTCEVVQPFSQDLAGFAEAFAETLNQQLNAVSLAAVWTPAHHLLLTHKEPGRPLEIEVLPASELKAPDLGLDLQLPEGIFGSVADAHPAAELSLNGLNIALNDPPEPGSSLEVCAAWLSEGLNHYQHVTGVHAAVAPDQRLHFQALSPQQPLLIADVSASLEAACGLQPMRLGEVDVAALDASLRRWTLLLNQILRELPEQSVFDALAEATRAVPPLAGHFDDGVLWSETVVSRFLEPLCTYLEAVTAEVETCLSTNSLSVASLRPLQLELEIAPPAPTSGRSEAETPPEPPPASTFDHKI